MQPLWPGGTNNYVLDAYNYTNTGRPGINPGATQPEGTIQVFELPTQWPGGAPLHSGELYFASWIYQCMGVRFEVAFSRCKGDFSYYQSPQAAATAYGMTFYPCGTIMGTDFTLFWHVGNEPEYVGTNNCILPAGEPWYLNWRIVPGSVTDSYGRTCGGTFGVHGN